MSKVHPPVTVIDSIMGSGKTHYIANYMNSLGTAFREDRQRFIYVTPLVDEATRIQGMCPDLNFKQPVQKHGRKFLDFKELIREGCNIATSHELFKKLDYEAYMLLQGQGYVLVVDEALSCLEVFDGLSSKQDREWLFNSGTITVDEVTGRLCWSRDCEGYDGRFSDIKALCMNGNLVAMGKGSNKMILFWEFAADFLDNFKEVYILTYLYAASPMSLYLRLEGFQVDMKAISGRKLVNFEDVNEKTIKDKVRSLVTVYEGPKNKIGERQKDNKGQPYGRYPFSSGWYGSLAREEDKKTLKSIRGTIVKFFERDVETTASVNAWTCLKEYASTLKGKGYSKNFIPLNAKATNKFDTMKSLAYVANIFYHTPVKSFFESKKMDVPEDLFALGEMLQWVWRSAIRKDEAITVFIPSERMRDLFLRWLHSDDAFELISDITGEAIDRKAEVRSKLAKAA